MASTDVKGAEANEDNREVVEGTADPPLKYKTWVLKVSIHCEGCKRKVKKILHSVDGVYTTEIDLRQQKVTVNGDVEADTLINRLVKMGRHADLWPLKDNKQWGPGHQWPGHRNFSKSKHKHGDLDISGQEGENSGGGEGEKENAKREEKAADTMKRGPEDGAFQTKNGVVVQIKDVNGEVKHMVPLPTGYPVAVYEGEGGMGKTGASSSGGKKKKKKKRGSRGGGNSNNYDGEGAPWEREHAYDAPPGAMFPNIAPGHGGMFHPASMSPRCHQPNQFPPQAYYAEPAPPAPTFSYHTSHPSSSYGTSFYYSSQPHSHVSAYEHPFSPEIEHVPSDLKMSSSPAAEAFHILSEENPHACLVM